GTLTFKPYQVLPVQVKNTSSSARSRRMNPNRTVYKVYYKDVDGKGYQWTDEAITRKAGQDMVDAGFTVERRILSIPDRGTYITVKPEQTAKSYTEGLQKKNRLMLGVSAAYILLYLLAWCIIWSRRREG
ncbi:MAG: hypothetical protein K2M91_13640, partial [Lachnospiraceae bacterium]|nr:hypothetical protein [Lachnospiraceae bacterium]